MERETEFLNAIRSIWREVLDTPDLDPERSFFEMGGDSLGAMRVAAQVYDAFGIEMTVRVLFENPHLRQFASRIAELSAGHTQDSLNAPPSDTASVNEFPLSYGQEGLLFLDRAGMAGGAYNVPLALRLRGSLNVQALDRAFTALLERHESLRTRFVSDSGAAVQTVDPPAPFRAQFLDVSALPLDQARERGRLAIQTSALEPFDLSTGPLFRSLLVRLEPAHHILLIATHHIVSDGWSLLSVLMRELGELYRQASGTGGIALPPLPVQYRDYVRWQREWLQGSVLDEQREYWRSHLAGAPALLNLPADRPRPPIASTRGAGFSFEAPADVCNGLRELASSEGATLFMVVLAAYAALLSRWSGQSDVVIGSPAAGRTRTEFEPLIGYFVNSLVLRVDLSQDPPFRQLVRQVKETALAAFAHQHLPFEMLVAELQPERDLSRHPIVQVSLSFQNFPREAVSLPGLEVSWIDDEPVTSKFDLSMYVQETPAGLRGAIEYATDLFDAATIEHFADSFRQLLASIVENPGLVVTRLPLLTPRERQRQVAHWNATHAPFAHEKRLHELIAGQAAQAPEALAVIDPDGEISYAELDRRANRLAYHLRSLGVGPEVVVGLYMRRTSRMVVALLAILKTGAAYMPLDEQLPADRMAYMLEDAAVLVVATETALQDALPSFWGQLVCVDDDVQSLAIEAQPGTSPAIAANPGNLAYVIYTSGSTGNPKGVLVTHRSVVNLLEAHRRAFGIEPGDRVLQFTRLSFDVSLLEILIALTSGAALCVLGVRPAAIGPELTRILLDWRVTVAMIPPALLAALPDQPFPLLRLLFTGGEALDPALAARWSQGRRFVNEYGITETTVCATIDEHVPGTNATSIGRPIANVRAYVLDEYLEPVPERAAGMLYIGGEGVARGYLRRPGLTAQTFVADPFGPPGSRLYATGDRVRRRNDGNLSFIGRTDDQVKVRGHRVELGEIEAALLTAPGVEQAAAIAQTDSATDTRLAAYVTCSQGWHLEEAELRNHLRAKLPEFMVPAAILILEAFPLTNSGKIDRKKLPLLGERPNVTEYVPPRTEPERQLASVWQRVLTVDRVGLLDHFFELGGDSILALRVQAEAQKLGIHFTIVELFEQPVLGHLAELASRSNPAAASTATKPFDLVSAADRQKAIERGYADAYPLSKLQIGMLFHSEWQRDSRTYHAATSHRLDKPLDVPKLRAAIQSSMDRHPVLRTTFHLSGYEEPLQCVRASEPALLETEDIGHLPREQQDKVLDAFIEGEKRSRFDLARGPMLRFFAHRLGAAQFQLTMSSHHAILDGWSDAAVLTELYLDYMSRLEGTAVLAKDPLPLTFRDYIAAERRALADPEHEAYWSNIVGALPHFNLWLRPKGTGGPADSEIDASDTMSLPFDPGLLRTIADFAAQARVPMKSVFLAAHLHALRTFTGSDSVVTGLVTNARLECPHGDEVPGLYLNTAPVQFRAPQLPQTACWLDLARHALSLEEEVLRHRSYPVVEVLRRHSGRDTLEVIFDFINFHVYGSLADRLQIQEWKPIPQTNFPLVVVVRTDAHVGNGEVAVTFHINRISPEHVNAFLEFYAFTIQQMTSQPRAPYSQAPLLPQSDRVLIEMWNRTVRDFAQNECIHDIISARAACEPDAIAVADASVSLTYAELDQRSNQLAHYLRSAGAGPEVIVGICLDRSAQMIVGLLGILKAGSAYLPLDPGYPEERLALMLDEARVPLLLSAGALSNLLPSAGARLVDLEGDARVIDSQPVLPPLSAAKPDNLAYVIYTSGSTGKPKGVLIQHLGLSNLVRAQAPDLAFRPGDRVLQFASLNFDASIWEIATTLAAGATLHLAPAERVMAGAELAEVLRERRITVAMLTPSALQSLGDPAGLNLPDLRMAILGGEPCPPELIRAWTARCRVVNAYGPTETSIAAAYGDLTGEDSIHLGRPVANTRLYVLNNQLQQVPVGAAGELFIAGAGVGRGYLGRPGLTAERFIADPFSHGGGRLYRSGDLVRYRPDGALEFLGRVDRQVKIRGFRIELGEVEAALAGYPGIAQAVVVPRGEDMRRTLVAYLVYSPAVTPDINAMRAHLRLKLPDNMRPSAFVVLRELPLSPNGKIDRDALPAPETLELAGNYVAPRTPFEGQLAAIWSDMLGAGRVGVYDDFFVLGGHSLVATRVTAAIRDTFHVDLPIRALFDSPTVADLAERIENERWLIEQAMGSSAASSC